MGVGNCVKVTVSEMEGNMAVEKEAVAWGTWPELSGIM